MNKDIYINGIEICSSAGKDLKSSFNSLLSESSFEKICGYKIGEKTHQIDLNIRNNKELQYQDRAIQHLIHCAELLEKSAVSELNPEKTGVIIASSRGATDLLEKAFQRFSSGQRLNPKTSPRTTAGIFSSFLAQRFALSGGNFSLSSACTSSLNSIGVGYHLIKSGLFDACLSGGAEAPLTDFTRQMLKEARVTFDECTRLKSFGDADPDDSLLEKRKGMVLGEAAGLCILSKLKTQNSMARIKGFSMASEDQGLTGLSPHADSLVKTISNALESAKLKPDQIDLLVVHGSGTLKGDQSEMNAYKSVFGSNLPPMLISKWATGHTLGAAGVLSVGFALCVAERQIIPKTPYQVFSGVSFQLPGNVRRILICSLGFGGGASSLILETLK